MNRYKPVGWRNDSYRHSLASKGIRSSFVGKKSKFVNLRYRSTLMKPGVATSKGINRSFREMAKHSALGDKGFESEDVGHLKQAIYKRRKAKEMFESDLLSDQITYPPESALSDVMDYDLVEKGEINKKLDELPEDDFEYPPDYIMNEATDEEMEEMKRTGNTPDEWEEFEHGKWVKKSKKSGDKFFVAKMLR